LSAIDNPETPDNARADAPASGTIAGSVVGLAAARQIDASHAERAATVGTEAAVLSDLLGDV
jgi:hypothetical protein